MHEKMKLSVQNANRLLGLSLKDSQVKKLLEQITNRYTLGTCL